MRNLSLALRAGMGSCWYGFLVWLPIGSTKHLIHIFQVFSLPLINTDSLNRLSLTGLAIDVDQHARQPTVVLGDVERSRLERVSCLHHVVAKSTQNTVVWTGHTNVAQECSATRLDVLISRLDVSVGADNRRDATVQVMAHQLLVTGCLGMEIDKPHRDIVRNLLQNSIRCVKRAIGRLHENAADQADHCHLDPGFRLDNCVALAGCLNRKIRRSQNIRLGIQRVDDIPFSEDVISQRNTVDFALF